MGYANRNANNDHYLPRNREGKLSTLPPANLVCFLTKYFPRKSAEWVPDYMAGIGKSRLDLSELNVIYPKTTGVKPCYGGHAPGYIFKCGGTYANLTVDAKRWLTVNKE